MIRRAWTGGDSPKKGFYFLPENAEYRKLVSKFFKEQLRECGGLDLWKFGRTTDPNHGTTSMERARIFWNRAKLDAYATMFQFPATSK